MNAKDYLMELFKDSDLYTEQNVKKLETYFDRFPSYKLFEVSQKDPELGKVALSLLLDVNNIFYF